jgi:2,4-dienoyl-CoA reductase-like NADH-dependent reductase (Old Yellow Enzyme family)
LKNHGAHVHFLHKFLSPLSNRRETEYGGYLENRMRFPLEAFEAIRMAWPKDGPLGTRFSASGRIEAAGAWSAAFRLPQH